VLFFALFPEASIAARIAKRAREFCRERGLKGRPIAADRLHVSLHGLGGYQGAPGDVIRAAQEAAGSLATPPFDLSFDRIASFRGSAQGRPLVLLGGDGVAACVEFQRALGAAMRKAGLGRWVKFGGALHMTLLYGDRLATETEVEPIGWKARELVLVDSLQWRTRHLHLARWRLEGA
jgi:2'-5' RNA ligase